MGREQLVPADYVALCNQMLPHNPDCPYTLMFDTTRTAMSPARRAMRFGNQGAGGFAVIVVPVARSGNLQNGRSQRAI